MTKPALSYSTSYGRFYNHPSQQAPAGSAFDGPSGETETAYSPKPSITNIISVIDEGFLPSYYAKLVATEAVEHFDGLKYQIETFGAEVAINSLKSIPKRSNEAAKIGDEVHAAIDNLIATGVEPEEYGSGTARDMFSRFKNFLAFNPDFEILRTEFTVWSYNSGYAGTGDLLVRFQDRLWIVDTKTGSRVYPKVALQCAALANADVILEEDGTETPLGDVLGGVRPKLGVLHVRPRSARLYELQHQEEAWQAFLAAKQIFDWQRYWKAVTVPRMPVA